MRKRARIRAVMWSQSFQRYGDCAADAEGLLYPRRRR